MSRKKPYRRPPLSMGPRTAECCPFPYKLRRDAWCRKVRPILGNRVPPDDELAALFIRLGMETRLVDGVAAYYRYRMDDGPRLDIRGTSGYTATPGTPNLTGEERYRSSWERSVAASLTRLGIAFSYECESFAYPGRDHRIHRYTPDFRLDDFKDTFVEVKGRAGPDAADTIKMQRVLRRYPRLTLLLWDADVVEFIEDISEPMFVVQLITTTRLAAA